jgi:hypothetical protein
MQITFKHAVTVNGVRFEGFSIHARDHWEALFQLGLIIKLGTKSKAYFEIAQDVVEFQQKPRAMSQQVSSVEFSLLEDLKLPAYKERIQQNGGLVVSADSVESFLREHGKTERYEGRTAQSGWNDDYFATCVQSRKDNLAKHGYACISHHDAKAGVAVYLFLDGLKTNNTIKTP